MNAKTDVVSIWTPPPSRLPYPRELEEAFGLDRDRWRVLIESIFPSARTTDSIVMALAYCRQRNLDVFKRPVHIVPMYNKQKKAYVETIWPGISELRTTAFRTNSYAGLEAPEWGPTVTKEFKTEWDDERTGERRSAAVSVTFPEWCRITVLRALPNGHIGRWVGPKVLWMEQYATQGRTDLPNEMWRERPEGQLEKCAEAAALRRAFPEEIGNELTAEEMSGRMIEQAATIDHAPVKEEVAALPAVEASAEVAAPPPPHQVQPFFIPPPPPPRKAAEPAPPAAEPAPPAPPPAEPEDWVTKFDEALAKCTTMIQIGLAQTEYMAPNQKTASNDEWERADILLRARVEEITS